MSEKSRVLDIFKITIDDFNKEYSGLKKKVDEIDFHLQEKVRYLETFVEKEESDFKLFSPRDVESVHREEIEEKNKEIDCLEKEKKDFFQKMSFLKEHINKLTVVYESIAEWDGSEFTDLEKKISDKDYFDSLKYADEVPFDYRLLIMDVLEKDRQRLARELHDSTIQDLTHVIHVLELADKFSDKDIKRTKLELISAQRDIRETIDNLRNIVFDLRPMSIDDLGFRATFDRLKYHIENISNMKVNFEIDEIENDNSLDFIILYRIIQELCMNAVKHASATKLDVSLKLLDDVVMLKVIDNGIGFNSDNVQKESKTSFGLEMTKERVSLLNGNMKIVSEEDIGTSIIISFHVASK
jgi:two-component system sensor histidine kinase DegS